MPQNPFDLVDVQPLKRTNPFDAVDEARTKTQNPFDTLDVPSAPTPKVQMNAFGRAVNPLIQGGKTAVGTVLDYVGRPQAALFGGILEGAEGVKAGLMGEKKYTGKDLLGAAGWEGDSWGKAGAGLALDLVADPVNLVGMGPIKKGYQAAVSATGHGVEKAIKATPVAKTAYKAVESFFDPHAALKPVAGLKDWARLKESEARSIANAVHTDVASVIGKNIPPGGKAGVLVKTFDQDTLKKIAYAVDKGDLSKLNPDELNVATKFKQTLENQWLSEVGTGHQAVARGPRSGAAPKIQDYVPYITKPDKQNAVSLISDVRGTTRHSKPRTFASLADAVNQGNATDDLAEILKARLQSGRMAQHGTRVLDEAANKFGAQTPQAGWRKLNIPQDVNLPASRKAGIADKFFPPEAADYLERAHAVFNKPDDVLNAYKKGVQVYKSWLVTNPQQMATNLLGNIVNATMSDNVPSVVNMARSVPIVLKNAMPPALGKLPNGGFRYSGDQVLDAMKRYEIIGGQGQYQDIFEKGANYSLNPLKANNLLGRYFQFGNQHVVEEPFKVAQFLQSVEDGMDLEQAAIKVKNTFFDYAEISPMAKQLRDTGLVPFITWQVKNVPLQLENLAMRPQGFARTESVMDAVSNPDTIMPHQDQREGMVPVGDNSAFRFASPINDLNKLPIGDYRGKDLLLDTVGQSLGLRQLLELTLPGKYEGQQGRKLYNDQPIWREDQKGAVPYDFVSQGLDKIGLGALAGIGDNEMGQRRQDEFLAYMLQQNPWGYYGRNIFGPPDELVEKGAVEDPKDRNVLDRFGDLTGFRTKELKPNQQVKELEFRMKQMMEK